MKESDIRPSDILQRYFELSRRDAHEIFCDVERFDINCVACGSSRIRPEFIKHGFDYGVCEDCGTLFVTPRPPLAAFEKFYQNSASSNYWAEVFFPAVAEVRREKIFKPRVHDLYKFCEQRQVKVEHLVDVGAGYGIFLEEWKRKYPKTDLLAVEPSLSLAKICAEKKIEVVETIVEQVPSKYDGFADMVVCFEVLEHIHHPKKFVEKLKRLARPGGLVFISTLSCDGFDIKTLWSKSDQISPPHHINFFSKLGFEKLFSRIGLIEIEVVTPGKLDVDIVRNYGLQNPTLFLEQPFLKDLVMNNQVGMEFQDFLVRNCLSSHAWVLGRVPYDGNID